MPFTLIRKTKDGISQGDGFQADTGLPRQIQAFRRFQELTVELISLGEKISNTAISDTEEKNC